MRRSQPHGTIRKWIRETRGGDAGPVRDVSERHPLESAGGWRVLVEMSKARVSPEFQHTLVLIAQPCSSLAPEVGPRGDGNHAAMTLLEVV